MEHSTLKNKYSNLGNEYQRLNNKCTQLDNAYDSLRKRCSGLDLNNDELRSQIATMGSAQEPLHEENHYILQFHQIDIDISSFAATHTRLNKTELSEEAVDDIVTLVAADGKMSVNAAENLKIQLRKFHESRKISIPLTRHVIASFLFTSILNQFAFGLTEEQSKHFKYIEEEVYNQGV